MIDRLKTKTVRLLRSTLKLLSIGQFHRKRIVFFSYFGSQYSCNPKYISEYILANAPAYEIVWAFNQPEAFAFLKQRGIKLTRYNSLAFLRICLTSRYIITNSETPAWFPLTRRQTLINTWHGGGAYKKVGAAYHKETEGKQRRAQIARENPCTYLSSSTAFSDMTLRQSFAHTGEILAFGMPRNDMLVRQNRDDLYETVKAYYHIPQDNHILLYAPTYRESKKASDYLLDCEKVKQALSERFGGGWSILYRMHYFVMGQLQVSDDYIDASDYPDMQELLYVSDVLITDYSSSMWDFALTYKPCFLYAADLDYYDLSRGFYTDIHTWPYPLCEDTEELISNIRNFDEAAYRENIQTHLKTLGNLESGRAAQKVLEYMEKTLASRADSQQAENHGIS